MFYQPTKSAADCTRSMAKLVRHYRRHGHRLRLIRSDPDKPLLAAADLLEDKFRGLKMRHANPEEHERVFENFYKTIKGDTICIKEQLPYELPQRYLKYAYAYAVDRRNAMPNDKTLPLTPSILFSGTRPAVDLLPFGATVMVRKGRAKRALDGQLAGKTELAVILGTLQRVVNRRMRNSYSSKLTLGKPMRPKMSQGKIPSIETFLYIPPMVES